MDAFTWEEIVIGACEALRTERVDLTGEQVVRKSLEIAEKFMGMVQGPFTILKTKSRLNNKNNVKYIL